MVGSTKEEPLLATGSDNDAAIRDAWRADKTMWALKVGISTALSLLSLALYTWCLRRSSPGCADLTSRILLVFGVVYLLRIVFASIALLSRPPSWQELIIVWCIFFPSVLTTFGLDQSVWHGSGFLGTLRLCAAIALYVTGSALSTVSEAQRKVFKGGPESKGKLMMYGVWSWSMHPNYLGDVLLFSGWALANGRWWSSWVPVSMLLSFVMWHIPGLDEYLAKNYPNEFPEYSAKTAKLIPGLY